MTKNLHLEHPEDMILTGDLSVLDWFAAVSHTSVKLDELLLSSGELTQRTVSGS